jgi:hypothetical protein
MALRTRTARSWSWNSVRKRTLAVYQSKREGRLRAAVLLWQADDPRIAIGRKTPPLLAFTVDVEPEPGMDNAVALAGFDSLEAARGHCVEWAGGTDEGTWDTLAETAQIGVFAAIREPDFADRG